jgi:tetratricopeptide (TPR) repeat protein
MKTTIVSCFHVVAFLVFLNSEAQNIDSLSQLIENANDDTSKINLLNDLGKALMYNNPDTSVVLGKQALALSEKNNSDKHKANSLLNLGNFHSVLGDYDKGLKFYAMALALYKQTNNVRGMAVTYNSMGIANAEKSEFNIAVDYYLKSLELMQQLNDKKGIGIAYNSIGNIYTDLADYPQAIEYHLRSLKTKKELNDKDGMALSYNNLGVAYKKQSDFPKALDNYFKSLEIREEMKDKRGMAMSLDNIGGVYREQLDYKQALNYHLKALELVKELGYSAGIAYSYNNMGSIYAEQKDYKTALQYFRSSLAILMKLGHRSGMAIVYNNIGGTYNELYSSILKNDIASKAEVSHASTYLDSALSYLQNALAINKEFDIKESMIYNIHDIGGVLVHKKKFPMAIDYYTSAIALAKEIGNLQGEYEAHNGLAEAYQKWADAALNNQSKIEYLQKSIEHHDQYDILGDSIFNDEKQKEIGKLEGRHEYEMASIKRKQEDKERSRIAAMELTRRDNLQYSASLLAICLLFGGLFFVSKMTLPKWAIELAVFVPFLILFEFLLVLTDPYVDTLTGGAPGLSLLINACLAGLIFPVHGFFEQVLRKRLFKKEHLVEINAISGSQAQFEDEG